MDFYKIFAKKKSSLSHHIMGKKKGKKKTHPLSPTTHLTSPKKEFPKKSKKKKKEKKKPQPSYLEKQSNFSLPCHPRDNPLG